MTLRLFCSLYSCRKIRSENVQTKSRSRHAKASPLMGNPLLISFLVANSIFDSMDESNGCFRFGQQWSLLMSSSTGLHIHTVPMLAAYFSIMFLPRAARFDRYKLQTYSTCIYSVDIFEGMERI